MRLFMLSRDTSRLLRHRRAQDLRPEEGPLRPLNDLLIHALRGMVHDHGAGFVVNLCVYLCVSDQVDNPFLAFRVRQTESGRQVPVP